jgi:hypothetical protein
MNMFGHYGRWWTLSRASVVCTLTVVSGCILSLGFVVTALPEMALASDVPCQFKATNDTTEVHVVANGKTLWTGSIEKLQTTTLSIPEGPFTVISKVYNENLKTTGDVRTDTHTRQCRDNAVLAVPLFQDSH